ncbi:hypothetical protein R4K92_14770 [Brachyspira intermedia]|uniref:hypothetical protein n=1 Tax=Brachyspira intermedia TaxID=84377 RepID=UPI00300666F4
MKKIILIGPQAWFVDSFIYFIEKGFKGIVLKISGISFIENYPILSEIGYDVIDYDENKFDDIGLDRETLIISICGFGGVSSMNGIFREFSFNNLEALYKISKYNKENNCGAKVIKCFNGDTGFSNNEYLSMLKEKLQYVDVFTFDNSLLEELIIKNIDYIKNKKRYILWMETPLKRYVNKNDTTINEKKYLTLGRIISSIPIDYMGKLIDIGYFFNYYPPLSKNISILLGYIETLKYKTFYIFGIKINIKKKDVKAKYSLAGIGSFQKILEDRKLFFENYKNISFGISHFYDILNGSVNSFIKNKDLFFSINGQDLVNNVNSNIEMYYGFCNNASKDLTYLMNGIIPLIPHNLHNIYKSMVDKKMAILINNKKDIYDVLNLTDEQILEYRKNIYENLYIFTFDNNAEILINELENNN